MNGEVRSTSVALPLSEFQPSLSTNPLPATASLPALGRNASSHGPSTSGRQFARKVD